jgi:hypothetical protein
MVGMATTNSLLAATTDCLVKLAMTSSMPPSVKVAIVCMEEMAKILCLLVSTIA